MGNTIDWVTDMEVKNLSNFFNKIDINAKNMNVFAGENTLGKTATCLHITDEAIKKELKVLYFDTENKVFNRPEPNLFKTFVKKNPKLYAEKFFLKKLALQELKFDEEGQMDISSFKNQVDDVNPDLIIIDSIYTNFCIFESESRRRATLIGIFALKLRNYMMEKGFGVVLTTKLGKIVWTKKNEIISQNSALGGQELLYNCDQKILMVEVNKDSDKLKNNKKIKFQMDKQFQFILNIDEGGIFTNDY